MKILSYNSTKWHNPESLMEGPYRLSGFEDTVTKEEIDNLRVLSEKYLQLIHSKGYIQKVKGACKVKSQLAEAQLSPKSFDSMLDSVSLALLAAQQNGFAVTRPPGHHAFHDKAEGFCFFNNVAIGVAYLLEQGKKVCIIDIDGHHGNGTEALFAKNNSVMMCSIYQENVYPHVKSSSGTNSRAVRIPLMEKSGDDVFLEALRFLKPYIEKFNPDCFAISAGFDGYHKDKLLDLNYSKAGYYEAGKYVADFKKPIFAALEGGYHEEIKECVDFFIAGIEGRPFDDSQALHASPKEQHMHISSVIDKLTKALA